VPKRFAPLTTDPTDGTDEDPDGLLPIVVEAGVVPVPDVVGVVLAHPAIPTAITTSTIAIIVTYVIFKTALLRDGNA
jgi:hypothetical protein